MSKQFTFIPNFLIEEPIGQIGTMNPESSYLLTNDNEGYFVRFSTFLEIQEASQNEELFEILTKIDQDQIERLFNMAEMQPKEASDNYRTIKEMAFDNFVEEILEDMKEKEESPANTEVQKNDSQNQTHETKNEEFEGSLNLEAELMLSELADQTTESSEILKNQTPEISIKDLIEEKESPENLSQKESQLKQLRLEITQTAQKLATLEKQALKLESEIQDQKEKEDVAQKIKNEILESLSKLDGSNITEGIIDIRDKLNKMIG